MKECQKPSLKEEAQRNEQTMDLYQQELQRCLQMKTKRKALLKQRQLWQKRKLILKTILQSIMHNAVSCPKGAGEQFYQYRTSMADQSHVSGRSPTHRQLSAVFPTNDSRADRSCQKTHTSLRQHAPATRMNCSQDRETSVVQTWTAGYNLPQRQTTSTFRDTYLQLDDPDNCQNLQVFPTSANSSSGSVRRCYFIQTGSGKTLQQADALNNCQNVDVFPSTPSSSSGNEKRILAESVAVADYSSQTSHTQRGVLSYLPRTLSSQINHAQQNELDCLQGPPSSQTNHSQENVVNYTQSTSLSQFNHSQDDVYTRDTYSQFNHTQEDVLNSTHWMSSSHFNQNQEDVLNSTYVTSSSHFNENQEDVLNTTYGTSSSHFNHTKEVLLNSTHGMSSFQFNQTQEGFVNYTHGTSSSQFSHTQEDVLNFLSDTSYECPKFPSNLNDILDIISKDCQPPNSQPQSRISSHSATAVCPIGGSSSQSETSHSVSTTRNRKNKTIIKRQSCIKKHALKCNANIAVNAEDDDVEKSQTKSEVKTGHTVTVVQQMVARLTIDDTGK